MSQSRHNLAAVVYEEGQRPDEVLHTFAEDLRTHGHRVAGLVQLGGKCIDGQLAVTALHTGEDIPLLEDRGPAAEGCRLDVGQLLEAGNKVLTAIEDGADLVIINRFGKQEREGRGLRYVIERAINRKIPVLVAVARGGLPSWAAFSEDMSTTLQCDRDALNAWWKGVSGKVMHPSRMDVPSVRESAK